MPDSSPQQLPESDEALAARAARGDQAAFVALYDRHFHDIYDLSTWLPLGGGVRFTLTESPSLASLVSEVGVDNVSVAAPVPEPAMLLVLGSGVVGLAALRWRHRKN